MSKELQERIAIALADQATATELINIILAMQAAILALQNPS